MDFVTEPGTLETAYPAATPGRDTLDAEDMAFIGSATLVVLSSVAPDGVASSPRGGAPGLVAIARDARTLWVPDEAAGRVHETVRNLLADPRIGLLLLTPGRQDALRVRGTARVSLDETAMRVFADRGLEARSVIVVAVADVRRTGTGPLRRSGL